jgi:DNA-directed RNA polymerase specialized sigma24 family protein
MTTANLGKIYYQNNKDIPMNTESNFWEEWLKHKDYLYQCCVKWMGNLDDAEDALSQAMIKARDKVLAFTGTIKNFKSWLTKLTYNLCVDIYRKRHRGGVIVESWEAIAPNYEDKLISQEDEDLTA